MTSTHRTQAILSLSRALWGSVTPNLRAAAVKSSRSEVAARMIYADPPTEDELEMASVVEAEIWSDFPDIESVSVQVDTVPQAFKRELLAGEYWVFMRHEPDPDEA